MERNWKRGRNAHSAGRRYAGEFWYAHNPQPGCADRPGAVRTKLSDRGDSHAGCDWRQSYGNLHGWQPHRQPNGRHPGWHGAPNSRLTYSLAD